MTFKVEFTPEADADLDRLFDFLLERAQTVEDAMRAYEARRASSYLSRRQAASGCLSLLCCTALGTSWRSGFRVTWSMCDQLRVERDQRCGLRWRAWI